jgi:hypothetical protein
MPEREVAVSDPEGWDAWAWAGWETDRHYRRLGRSGTAFFGRGPWLENWRQRLIEDRTLQALADAGLRTLVTCFYKGFGLQVERQEWSWLRALVAGAHHRGLRVLGYIQGGSLYYETLLDEQPDLAQWVARQRGGAIQTWGGSYYRWRPCLTNDDYLRYMEGVVRAGLTELQLDGLHFDNSYYRHCWCERCATRFRQWLDQRDDLDERMGLPSARHVQPPPLDAGGETYSDPLQILWMQFGAQVRNEAYGRLTATARACRPNAVLVGNPAFPRRSNYLAELALDLPHEAGLFDMLFAENGNLPQCSGQSLVTQAEAYLFADALGYRVLSTAWKTGENEALPPQSAGEVWAVMAEEFSYHAAVPGNNWMLRPAGHGDRLLADDAPRMEAFRDASTFFHGLHDTIGRDCLRQWGEVGLYVELLTLSLSPCDRGVMRTALAALMRMGVPVVLTLAGRPIPPSVRTLLVLEQTCLSDASLKQVADFARGNGHGAIVAGQSGRCDEWFLPRDTGAWRSWRTGAGMIGQNEDALNWGREQAGLRYMAADRLSEVQAAMATLTPLLARGGIPSRLSATLPEGVLMNAESDGSRLVVHLRDQAGTGQFVAGCRLQLSPNPPGERRLWLLAPAAAPRALSAGPSAAPTGVAAAINSAAGVEVSIPPWRHYAAVIVGP